LAEGQNIAALSGRFIGPLDRRCQRLLSTNRRIASSFFAVRGSPDFSRANAALEPQSCDDLAYISGESAHASGDGMVIGYLKEKAMITVSLSPFSRGRIASKRIRHSQHS
jgi:hypothetical protein